MYTPWQTQTSRGFHLWYRHPGVRVPNRARIETRDGRLAIDVRGDGGYVIAPGSVHASGAGISRPATGRAARARAAVLARLAGASRARPPTPATSTRPTGDVVERAAAISRRFRDPRSDTAATARRSTPRVGWCAASASHATDAEALLWEWAGGRPGWTRDWIAAKVAHAERYGTEPIGALR